MYSAFEQFEGTFACAIPSTQEYKQTQIRCERYALRCGLELITVIRLAKSSRDDRGRVIPKKYEPLDDKATVRDQLQNWENVFVMWEDPNGAPMFDQRWMQTDVFSTCGANR